MGPMVTFDHPKLRQLIAASCCVCASMSREFENVEAEALLWLLMLSKATEHQRFEMRQLRCASRWWSEVASVEPLLLRCTAELVQPIAIRTMMIRMTRIIRIVRVMMSIVIITLR